MLRPKSCKLEPRKIISWDIIQCRQSTSQEVVVFWWVNLQMQSKLSSSSPLCQFHLNFNKTYKVMMKSGLKDNEIHWQIIFLFMKLHFWIDFFRTIWKKKENGKSIKSHQKWLTVAKIFVDSLSKNPKPEILVWMKLVRTSYNIENYWMT